ncbi:MAG: hypothetical protein CMJ49_06440 [Planctomycetaceae bacterium]|nr:hypothetical protein [Planctomycetaceae bacterium]
MDYRPFGNTGMKFSTVGLGGLLARYEARLGHPPPEEKQRIYRRAAELGVNLFDMGYGDEIHIPDELKGYHPDRFFALKAPLQEGLDLEALVDKHLTNIRRDTIDVLRVLQRPYREAHGFPQRIADLKQTGKIRSLCIVRHYPESQQAYANDGPLPEADADLVMYNYVFRDQEPGIELSAKAGKAVLIMKALGGQWINWETMTQADWQGATEDTVVQLAEAGEAMRVDAGLILPVDAGPWQDLARPGEARPRTARAISWVLENPAVTSTLVAFASVEEVNEALDDDAP